MLFAQWFRGWQRRQHRPAARRSPAAGRRRAPRRRLFLEELECRRLLSAGDSLATAIPFPLNGNPPPAAGVISPAPTYYALSVTDAGRLTAQVAPSGGATRLSLLSADGQVLVQSDGQSATNPDDLIDLHLTGSAAGTNYYLEVQGLGNAAGTYTLRANFTTATPPFQPLSVGTQSWGHTFDLNGDGIPDLVVANFNTVDVSVLLGRGDGTFAPETRYPVNVNPNDVTAVDLTGHGALDLVTANVDGALTILPGHGDGTFGAPTQIAVGGDLSSLVAGDFNGDGHMDLALADIDTGNVVVLRGHGDGTFAAPTYYKVGAGPTDLIAADFNHDGRLDLATANQGPNTVSVLLGNGDGTFQPARTFAAGQGPHSLVAGDFAGNGRLDIATANAGSNDVSVLRNNGDGTFGAATSLAAGAGTTGIVAGDFRGDGHLDLAATNPKDGTLSIFQGHGDGTFGPQTTLPVGSTPGFIVAADFNRDGGLDLAHGDTTGQVFVDLGRGDGTFQALPPTAGDAGPSAVTTGDFTGDGHLDLATVDTSADDVEILLGQGDGTFRFGGRYAVGPDPTSIATGDFNHDGTLDLVVTNASANTAAVLTGRGDGTFGPPTFFAVGGHPYDVVTGDFNADGNLDLAVADVGADRVSVLLGHGDGTFAAPLDFATDPGPIALVAGDFNGDGALDLATANVNSGDVSVLFGRGDGTFGNDAVVLTLPATGQVLVETPQEFLSGLPPQLIDVGPGPSSVALVDMTGDGRLDIVVTGPFSGGARVLYNDPAAPFTRQARFRAGTGLAGLVPLGSTSEVHSLDAPSDLVGGPFSGQMGQDLVVVNQGADSIALLRNDGQGGFLNPESPPAFLTGNQPIAVVAGHFTAGPDLDLAVLNRGSADVTIFLGDGQGGFTRGQTIAAGNDPNGLAVADINGDGLLDLLVGNAQGDVLTLLGNGDGTFRPYQRLDRRVTLAVGDVNAPQPEFVFADRSRDQVTVQYDQPGQSWLQDRQNGVLSPNEVVLADLNGDGAPDLIVANGGGNNVLVYLGLGDGQFGPAHSFFAGTDPVGITVADLNGDGIPDLVVANKGSNDVSVLFGQGRGASWALTQGPRLRADTGPVDTAVADVNGDGIPDILVANCGSNDVYLLPGVGGGFFNDKAPVIYQTGAAPEQVLAGYFGSPSRLDLVTVNAGSNDLTYFAGFGPGRSISSGGVGPIAAVMGDFNHDGADELIVANNDGHFALLSGDAGGLQVVSSVAPAGLTNVSDVALGAVSGNAVVVYATTEGTDAAVPVEFALDLSAVLPPGTFTEGAPPTESTPGRTVTVFSPLPGSPLGVVATLVAEPSPGPTPAPEQETDVARVAAASLEAPGKDAGQAESEAGAARPVSPLTALAVLLSPTVWVGDGAEDGPDEAPAADPAAVERNALLSGLGEVPVEQYLRQPATTGAAGPEVPFPSSADLLDAGAPATGPAPEEAPDATGPAAHGNDLTAAEQMRDTEQGEVAIRVEPQNGNGNGSGHGNGGPEAGVPVPAPVPGADPHPDQGGLSLSRLRTLAVCLASALWIHAGPDRRDRGNRLPQGETRETR